MVYLARSIRDGWLELTRVDPDPMPDTILGVFTRAICDLSEPVYLSDDRESGWLTMLSDGERRSLVQAEASLMIAKIRYDSIPSHMNRDHWGIEKNNYRSLEGRLKLCAADRLLGLDRTDALDHARCWKVFKKLSVVRSPVPIHPEVLFSHFEAVYFSPNEPLTISNNFSVALQNVQSTADDLFTLDELDRALRELNVNAATGPDGISPKLLFALAGDPSIKAIMLRLFNSCYLKSITPLDWSASTITVLFKGKGSVSDPSNYRGINILNSFFKMYERLLFYRLDKWASGNVHLHECQFGFRRGRATLDAIFLLREVALFCTRILFKPLHVVFVDLIKAFPSVKRGALISLLFELNVPPRLVCAISSVFSFNTCRLKVGNRLTREMNVNVGVREGGVLSPLLFAIVFGHILKKLVVSTFWNGVKGAIDGVFFLPIAFADDLALVSTSTSVLNQHLAQLEIEFAKFGMKISVEKTKAFTFWVPNRTRRNREDIFVYGSKVEWVREFKYLGVLFEENGKIKSHTQTIIQRANAALSLTANLMHKLGVSDHNRLKQFFFAFVVSQFYGLIFFDLRSCLEIDNLKKVFIRRIFYLHRSFPHWLLDLVFPIEPAASFAARQRVSFLLRNFHSSDWSPAFDAFCLSLCELRVKGMGWFFDLERMCELSNVDIVEDWVNGGLAVCDAIENKLLIDRVTAMNIHEAAKYCRVFVSECAIFPDFLRGLFSLEAGEVKGILLLLSGCGRWVFFGTQPVCCPKCSVSPFRSLHLMECSGFWNQENSVLFFERKVREKEWDDIIQKLRSILFFWCELDEFRF